MSVSEVCLPVITLVVAVAGYHFVRQLRTEHEWARYCIARRKKEDREHDERGFE